MRASVSACVAVLLLTACAMSVPAPSSDRAAAPASGGVIADHRGSTAYCESEGAACVDYGVRVFQQRCALCHGYDGHGEGLLPLTLGNYPDTNLLRPRVAVDEVSLRRVVRHGGSLEDIDATMPPWGDELTVAQYESVIEFVQLLRADTERARAMLARVAEDMEPSRKLGRGVYIGRCALCHGKAGEGDGRMARIIRNPPPFDLTLSRQPDGYLRQIILEGGEAVGRSPRMPPWSTDLTGPELESVIAYIKTFRH